ncbi:hypothetical protein [Bacillus sp. V59.32b]|uniref:hypothetical protein n=1 Tax=Bacillus sp. V59.32b TaxID=1758642 RepID=UPI001C1FB212|nr:hypothetical protein [Bacillus sp. V59.32b]
MKPPFIKQWDDLPEDYDYNVDLNIGSEILWGLDDGQYTKLTVITWEPQSLLRISLYNSRWERPLAPEDIAYTYSLSGNDGNILLSIEIGDFGKLPDGEKYFEASVEFAEEALQKNKALLNDNVVFGKGICETPRKCIRIFSCGVYSRMMNQRPAEKRAGKTPQRGTSEEACQFVRGKRVDSMTI